MRLSPNMQRLRCRIRIVFPSVHRTLPHFETCRVIVQPLSNSEQIPTETMSPIYTGRIFLSS